MQGLKEALRGILAFAGEKLGRRQICANASRHVPVLKPLQRTSEKVFPGRWMYRKDV
jgi:hypothetical protein